MSAADLVRASRDGDQFHYVWAARQCLGLLPGGDDLVAVTIEGSSPSEVDGKHVDAGEELIDVGLYYGAERIETASRLRYVQLKHSSRRTDEPWTASGLEKTIAGFGARYRALRAKLPQMEVDSRLQFALVTNRPIDSRVAETLHALKCGTRTTHAKLAAQLRGYSGLPASLARSFFKLLEVDGLEDGLWAQKNLLHEDIRGYLPGADGDAPVLLKDLVSRKASSEFQRNPVIRLYDILQVLRVGPDDLYPAPNLIREPTTSIARAQEHEVLNEVLSAASPVIIHADGGVGKSIMSTRLARSMPAGSVAIVYDCFGDGMYRSAHNWRHRHNDACTQIGNELAARRLCHPLLQAPADPKAWVRALTHRLNQAAGSLVADNPDAVLCIIIDAADNAEMAARDLGEPGSFVRDLIRMPLPAAVRLVFTCRTHRRTYLQAPVDAIQIELQPFSFEETSEHLRQRFDEATDNDVAETRYLSSGNPRVQAMAMSAAASLDQMLRSLGPNPTTIDAAIGELLASALAKLRDSVGGLDVGQIDSICRGLAVLRPLIPLSVMSELTGVDASAIRSFVFDMGRPLMLSGDTIHFTDEPAETWFRENFRPEAGDFDAFISRLRPLAQGSAYVASTLPQLLLEAHRHDELVSLALSTDGLPTANPLERREVELRRLTFALKASLRRKDYLAAAKLALKAAGEVAGEERQTDLLRSSVHMAGHLFAADQAIEIASRRAFETEWLGSHHVYDAVLLANYPEYRADAASRLRMAQDWLAAWARNTPSTPPGFASDRVAVSDEDRATLALAHVRVRGAESAATFLRRWRNRSLSFYAGRLLARKLIDVGDYSSLGNMARAARNNVWLILALAIEARSVSAALPAEALERLLKLIADRRIVLEGRQQWEQQWEVLEAVVAAIELALGCLPRQDSVWAGILKRYLPEQPPSILTMRLPYDRSGLLSGYALEAVLRGEPLKLEDVAPEDIRPAIGQGPSYRSYNADVDTFYREVGGLLPLLNLGAQLQAGEAVADPPSAILAAVVESAAQKQRDHQDDTHLQNIVARQWLNQLADLGPRRGNLLDAFASWRRNGSLRLTLETLIVLCRRAARTPGLEDLAFELAQEAHARLQSSRDEVQTRTDAYLELARAIFTASSADATAYLNEAIAIASRLGDENLERYSGLLHLGRAASDSSLSRPETAYRLARMGELTYEYVARDKYFPWDDTVETLAGLCPSSVLAILSRWRDRKFGDPGRLLPLAIAELRRRGLVPSWAEIALSATEGHWSREALLRNYLDREDSDERRQRVCKVALRYIRPGMAIGKDWERLSTALQRSGMLDRDLEAIATAQSRVLETDAVGDAPDQEDWRAQRQPVDWEMVFADVDVRKSDQLAIAYARMRSGDTPIFPEEFWKEAASRTRSGGESELMRALTEWPDASLYDVRYALDNFPSAWLLRPAYQRALRDGIISICRSHPTRVFRRGWGATLPFEDLIARGIVADHDVADAMIEGFGDTAELLDAEGLFRILDPLSSRLSPQEADEALNFGLDLMEPSLKPEDGDGPWSSELTPPGSVHAALAGYVWAGLGAPSAAERWASAHVVRNALEIGWTELTAPLSERTTTAAPGPFVDAGLHFYTWHARQWLVIGLARGAIDATAHLPPFVPWLREMARCGHILLEELARGSLRLSEDRAGGDLAPEGLFHTTPLCGEEVYDSYRSGIDDDPKAPEPHGDDKYYFGHDKAEYVVAPMGRVFGLSQRASERHVLSAIRADLLWTGRSWQDDARHTRGLYEEGETFSRYASQSRVDDLNAYHTYHGVMFAARKLLGRQPVGRRSDDTGNDLDDWMKRHRLTRADSRWLADRADPKIVRSPPGSGTHRADWPWLVTRDHLDAQLVSPFAGTVMWGDWVAGLDSHRETISVRSALVSAKAGQALMAALQTTAELMHHSLPEDSDEVEVANSVGRLMPWVSDEGHSHGLDEHDPWGANIRYPGAIPSKYVRDQLQLESDPDGRVWTISGNERLRSESWVIHEGYGREAGTTSCWRLTATPEFIHAALTEYPADCFILRVSVRRQLPRWANKGEYEEYQWPYVRYYLMGLDGKLATL